MRFFHTLVAAACTLVVSGGLYAQRQPGEVTTVSMLIRFNGHYPSASGQTSLVSAVFSIYGEENGGTPLWSESQTIQSDKYGNFTALLGSTESERIPAGLLTGTESRWLEAEIDQVKQARVRLDSAAYGLAPSANSFPAKGTALSLSPQANNGMAGCIGMFSDPTDLICSAITQGTYQGNPAVSVGASPNYLGALTLVGSAASSDTAGMALYNAAGGGGASVSLDMYNTFANGGIPQAKIKAIDDGAYSDHLTFWTKTPGGPNNPVVERMRITSTGNVGIGTTTPVNPLQMASGAYVTAGGVWTNASDRNVKENFSPVEPAEILEKIDELPVSEWNYKNEAPEVKHIGPVAQDFYSIFGLGNSSTSISTIDPSGIALVAIQALDAKGSTQDMEIARLKEQLETKEDQLRSLQQRLARLEKLLDQGGTLPTPR